MSIYIIQHNLYKQIHVQQKVKALMFVDMFMQCRGNTLLYSNSQSTRSYFILIETRNLENVQVLFEVQSDQKYLKLQFKPTQLIGLNRQLAIRSQRCRLQFNNQLQHLNKDNKFNFYKWYINKSGHLVIQIIYLLQQFSNQFHVQYILTKTFSQVTEILQYVVSKMVSYLNLQHYLSNSDQKKQLTHNYEIEDKNPSLFDKLKYMTLLNQVYKSHRNSSKNTQQKQPKGTNSNMLSPKLQTFTKTNTLVQSDTAFIEQLQKQKLQFGILLKETFRIINPKSEEKKDYLEMSKMYQTQIQFEQYVKSAKKQHLQIYQMTSMHYRIVKGIQNHTLLNKQKMLSAQGSHSVIYLGTYSIHLSDTLFTYQHNNIKEQQTEKKVITKPLITKRVKNNDFSSSVNSLRNEIDFLYFMKDKRSKFIATYFLPLEKEKQDVKQIFSEFYPFNLKEYMEKKNKQTKMELSIMEVLEIAENILFAMIFMVEHSVLHRDLKPFNVMMDENMKARVIDFGSCCPILSGSEFSVSQKRILTTPGYQKRYKECPQEVRQKYTKQEYEQHILYDIYSFGATLKEMVGYVSDLDSSKFGKQINVAEIIEMVVAKCRQPDPIDRVTFDELLYFIKVLKQIVEEK